MRKINHIELGKELSKELYKNIDKKYFKYKTFVFSNIIPDCIPTFIYIRHNIKSTFKKLEKLIKDLFLLEINTYKFWIKLGCIMHYISDYFTYPHTKIFNKGFIEHNKYEKKLRINFKSNIDISNYNVKQNFQTIDDILSYIKNQQNIYYLDKNKNKSIFVDIEYIGRVCKTVFENIIFYKTNNCFC